MQSKAKPLVRVANSQICTMIPKCTTAVKNEKILVEMSLVKPSKETLPSRGRALMQSCSRVNQIFRKREN